MAATPDYRKAQFCCLACGHRWISEPMILGCKCGHSYVKWVNYEACAKAYRREQPNGLAFGGPQLASATESGQNLGSSR